MLFPATAMPRKRPISNIADVNDLTDDDTSPAKRQKSEIDRWMARDVTLQILKMQQQSTKPCKKHAPVDPDIINPNPKDELYYLPKLEDTPHKCDGEVRELFHTYYSTDDLYSIHEISNHSDGRLSIILFTEDIKTLFKTQQRDIHISRTVNVGPCYMTMLVLRQKNLISKSTHTKLPPLIVGPILLHFDRSWATYYMFLMSIRIKLDLPHDTYDKAIKGVPKNDLPLVQAIRNVLGSFMELAGRQHSTGSIRRDMHCGDGRIKYNAPIMAVVTYIQERIYNVQSRYMKEAFLGEQTEHYALTKRAREQASQWFGSDDAYQKFLELVPDC